MLFFPLSLSLPCFSPPTLFHLQPAAKLSSVCFCRLEQFLSCHNTLYKQLGVWCTGQHRFSPPPPHHQHKISHVCTVLPAILPFWYQSCNYTDVPTHQIYNYTSTHCLFSLSPSLIQALIVVAPYNVAALRLREFRSSCHCQSHNMDGCRNPSSSISIVWQT